jgi:hypothetical protein
VFLETLGALAYKEIKKNGEFVLLGFGKLVKQKRGLSVDHVTIWRWVQRYAPELERRLRRHFAKRGGSSLALRSIIGQPPGDLPFRMVIRFFKMR